MRKTAYLLLLLVLILAFAVSGFSQAAQAPKWNNKAEYDAYNAAYNEKDPAKKADLAAKFLADYQQADISFRRDAYLMMTKGYLDAKNWAKAMDAAAKVDEALPGIPADKKAQFYTYGMTAAQSSDNVDKTVEFGEKILAVAPGDVNTLITLASLIPERLPTDDAGKRAALAKAEGYSKRALEALDKIAKPANFSDADWATQKANVAAGVHADLGFIALNRTEYEKAVDEYKQVLKATPKD